MLDKEVYIFSLTEANNAGLDERPKYFKLYDARNDLEMASLFPRDYDQVARRLSNDDEYYAKYFRFEFQVDISYIFLKKYNVSGIIIMTLQEIMTMTGKLSSAQWSLLATSMIQNVRN